MGDKRKKVLFVASIDLHILSFHLPFLQWFYEKGYDVHVACKGYSHIPFCTQVHQVDFDRSVCSLNHIRAFVQLRKILKCEDFTIIHCHTSIASVLTRLSAYKFRRKNRPCIIYTAHGFPFFKDSKLINWLVFFPIEKFSSMLADCIVTVNYEDYSIVKSNFYCKKVRLVPGMGVNINRFKSLSILDRNLIRSQFGMSACDKVIVYVAEFIPRKNHKFLLLVSKLLKEKIPKIKIVLPGRGILWEEMKNYAVYLGVDSFVLFPGYVENIESVYASSDVCVSCSKREGLGLHIVEAMMCGLPVVASNISGHRELVEHNFNGYLYPSNDKFSFINAVIKLFSNVNVYAHMSNCAVVKSEKFELQLAKKRIIDIYSEFL